MTVAYQNMDTHTGEQPNAIPKLRPKTELPPLIVLQYTGHIQVHSWSRLRPSVQATTQHASQDSVFQMMTKSELGTCQR